MVNIKVCDALCGAGKTVACINMMNEQADKRFIFLTPYLDEVDRIKRCCKGFVEPERREYTEYTKLNDLHQLIRQKKNIASTHALFSYYTADTIELIKQGEYTLILDEVINVFRPVVGAVKDFDILVNSNTLALNNDGYVWNDPEYDDGLFLNVKKASQANNLVKYNKEHYFWTTPPSVFKAFKEVYILTYLFEYQVQKYFFDIHGFKYNLIGVKPQGNSYAFCNLDEMNRKKDLRKLVNILDASKLNFVGEKHNALSVSWFERAVNSQNDQMLCILKNNVTNVYKNIYKAKTDEIMWTTFNNFKPILNNKDYASGFVVFNKRASNELAQKKYLAYCSNVYMQTSIKNYLKSKGAKNISENMYAVSTLVQWLFRSALRDGKQVYLYLPSSRMRYLLEQWLKNLASGCDLKAIKRRKNKNLMISELLT